MKTQRTRNYDNYTIEFTRSMVRYGSKTYTWFVSRPNFDRCGFHSSDTVWMFTTDDSTIYEKFRKPTTTKADFIKLIKSRPTTKVYNEPLF